MEKLKCMGIFWGYEYNSVLVWIIVTYYEHTKTNIEHPRAKKHELLNGR